MAGLSKLFKCLLNWGYERSLYFKTGLFISDVAIVWAADAIGKANDSYLLISHNYITVEIRMLLDTIHWTQQIRVVVRV